MTLTSEAFESRVAPNGRVLVVDDDPLMRSALRRLFVAAGLQVEAYASANELLEQADLKRTAVLLLDVRMPSMDGLQLQKALTDCKVDLPILFLSGMSDIPTAVAAMRNGACDFVEKPFDNDDLVARVRRAMAQGIATREREGDRRHIEQRLASLTQREREVLDVIVTGKTSKETARLVGTSHRTVEIHRAHIMAKMQAESLADLVRMHLLARS